ncbi:hypothetical protein BGZ95_004165 [Linnemannia exigua]|uniref:Uncharacterized protein n=1 Tax=Linnemannia exigua TaxID=604196 RepID=A0AAD4D3B8_9FUNG|nr:hypothetical protein BGZ95_004165 [Linnemannia exigua]
MSPTHRNYCCCCIPYRIAVLIVSLFALAFGGLNLWNVQRSGITDSITRYSIYVLAGVYLLLGVSGLFAVLIKKYAVAKNFSVLWWIATILITILSVAGIVLLATREQEEAKGLCMAAILEDNPKYQGNTPYTTAELADDVASCYRTGMIVIGVVTSVQLFLMIVGGSVASSYTSEVKHRKNGLTYTYGQGYAFLQPQPQPPMQQAPPQQYQKTHPYQHIG